jgi:hypothetical protein
MVAIDLKKLAAVFATYSRLKLSSARRTALLVGCTTDGSVVGALFGNDDYGNDESARAEVDAIRHELQALDIEELAFGLSPDSFSWSLLAKMNGPELHTATGKTFRIELMRAHLEAIVNNPAKDSHYPNDYSRLGSSVC